MGKKQALPWMKKAKKKEKEKRERAKVCAENRRLCERYPFLIPWNRYSGMLITEGMTRDGYWPGSPKERPRYDWSYTELDEMPEGWKKAFSGCRRLWS